MITPKPIPWQSNAWSAALATAVTDVDALLSMLGLSRDDVPVDTDNAFPLRVPRAFVARMEAGNPADPLLRQVLPLRAESAESAESAGYTRDPLGEAHAVRTTGMLQKYAGRALVIAAPACAVHCRYCFRRHFPYDDQYPGRTGPWLDAIAADATIEEVILSGGDPLMLKDAALERLVRTIAAIDHVKRLRLHTRLPVVIPERVTNELVALLQTCGLPTSVVIHANHPREIGTGLCAALRALREGGITLLNQSVLLRGVNDDAVTLAELSERLFASGVLPYYLHLPDPVTGTGHFHVPEEEGRKIVRTLSAMLPGYLVPRLAREVPGAPAKQVFANL
jgi:L-lysine 2,3-aminomutase